MRVESRVRVGRFIGRGSVSGGRYDKGKYEWGKYKWDSHS